MAISINITVSEPKLSPRSPFVTLRGGRHADVTLVFVGGVSQGTRFPTDNTWERDFVLAPGTNQINIYGQDAGGNNTSTTTLLVDAGETDREIIEVFNFLDEWGLTLNLPRLSGEKNVYYRNRLLHAEEKLGGTNYPFLIQALRRGLSFPYTESVLTISSVEDENKPVATGIFISVQPTRLIIEANVLRQDSESIIIDPGSREATLQRQLARHPGLLLVTRGGEEIRTSDIETLDDEQTIRVHGTPTELIATYKYVEPFAWDDYFDLDALVTGLNALTGPNTKAFLSATTTSGTRASALLVRPGRALLTAEDPITLDHCDLRLIEAWERRYQDSLLDADGLYFGTKLENLAVRLRAKSNLFIGQTVLDQDRVARRDVERGFSVLPQLADPWVGYYRCPVPGDSTRYTLWDFNGSGGTCPNHPGNELQLMGHSGTAFRAGSGGTAVGIDAVEEEPG